jgi:major curlin subunit
MTTIKSTVKAGLVGIIAAAGFGLIALPVKADEINQDAVQTTRQEGVGNTSVQQSTQNAEIDKSERRFGRRGDGSRSRDVINQTSDQLTDQFGNNNTSVNQNTQDARIRRERDVFNRR